MLRKNTELKAILANYIKTSNADIGSTYIGISRNIILDYISLLVIIVIIVGLAAHGYIRYYFNRKGGIR